MAGTVGSSRGGRGGIVGINVTPMVDVVLVLLVIMMVSATYIVSQSMKVELPKSGASDSAKDTTVTVTVTKDGAFLWDKEQTATPKDQIEPRLVDLRAKTNGDVNLVITGDTNAVHGNVVHVMQAAQKAKITKMAVSVERTSK